MARILCNVAGGGKPLKGNAETGDVLVGKTFSNKQSNALTGTMPNNGAWSASTSGNGSVTIPAGYHNGSGTVSGAASYKQGHDQGYNQGVSDADARVYAGSASYNAGYANGKNDGYNEGKAASRVEVSAYGNIYGQSGDEHAGVTVHLVVKVGGVVVYNNSASRFGNHGPSTDTLTYSN